MHRFCQLLALSITILLAASTARARDLSDMGAAEIKTLQQRLADAGCYQGAIDGQATSSLQSAVKACPSQDPELRIETGMHVASIKRIGVDKACHIAATGSYDKTVRVWSLPEGRLLRTLRVPIGPGDNGKIYAVSMSPDGRWIAAGGWDAQWEVVREMYVYIFDTSTGTLVKRVGPFGSAILQLTFSRDGRWLAATSDEGVGLKVIDAQTWRIVAEDKDYAGRSQGAAFAADGRLYTSAYDGKIRQYSPGTFKKEREIVTKPGGEPLQLAIDPASKLLAVGFAHIQAVAAYDLATLNLRFNADMKGIDNGDLSAVSWTSDGSHLMAGGQYMAFLQGAWKMPFFIFDRDGKRTAGPVPLSDSTIYDLEPCADSIAAAAFDPSFGLVDNNNQIILWKTGVAPDMRDKLAEAFTVSANTKQVRFGLGDRGDEPILFDLGQATVTSAPNPAPNFNAPIIDGMPVVNWKDGYKPSFSGKPITLEAYERSRALAIRPDKSGFVLGTEFLLRAFDAQGAQLWEQAGPGIAWGVNLSADGRVIVVAYADGTIQWVRWTDGKTLLTLFVNRKTKVWVAWTPSGYYMASPGGEDLIGWNLNRGWTQPADFFPASKFHDKFARADIVERILDTLDEAEAVRQADKARPQQSAAQLAPITENLPPVLSILSPGDNAHVDGATVTIDYLLRSPSGTAIDGVDALINGSPAGSNSTGDDGDVKKCIAETHGLGRTMGALQGCRGSLTISLQPGTSQIGVFAKSTDSKSSAVAEIRVVRSAPATAPAAVLKPKLYALVAGVSDYANPTYRLEYAAKDAHDFAGSLANQNGALYSEVDIKLLVDQKATAAAIKDGLDWLTHQVTANDVGIIYLAGHGLVDERNRYYFLPADGDATRLRATAVAKDDIQDALNDLAGKAILFLDACHAGSMMTTGRRAIYDNNEVVNDFLHSERGVVVFAASTGRQVSMEDSTWGNGAFTKALVEGLGSPGVPALAKIVGYDTITPAMLEVYVAERVKLLTGGQQSPVMNSNAPDFPMAVAK
jgi:hypothetical protein